MLIYTLYRAEGRDGLVPILQSADPDAVAEAIGRLPAEQRVQVFDQFLNPCPEFRR